MRLLTSLTPLVLFLFLAGSPVASWSQDRSDTGRSRVQRPKPVEKVREEMLAPTAPHGAWRFGFSTGLLGAGRAFQVETLNGASVPWDLGSGSTFQASRYNATFDQNLSLGLEVHRDIGTYWSANAAATYARIDLGAEALAGQQGLAILLDRIDVVQLGIGGTARLVAQPDHPFVSLEAVYTSLGAGRLEGLDQSGLGWRVGLGYRHILNDDWAARVQGRVSRLGFTAEDFQPEVAVLDPPGFDIDDQDRLTFFEIMLVVEFR